MNPPIPSAPPAVRSRPAPLPPVGPRHRVPPPHTTDPRRRWRLQSQSGTAGWELGALWAQWGHIQAWPGSVRKVWAGSGDTVAVTGVSRALWGAGPGCALAVRWAGQAGCAPGPPRSGQSCEPRPGQQLSGFPLRTSSACPGAQPVASHGGALQRAGGCGGPKAGLCWPPHGTVSAPAATCCPLQNGYNENSPYHNYEQNPRTAPTTCGRGRSLHCPVSWAVLGRLWAGPPEAAGGVPALPPQPRPGRALRCP